MTNITQDKTASDTARFNMIEQQIRTWEVLDPVVLQLLHDVPREDFVPEAYQGLAFADIEIPIGQGQTMLSPKLEGRILQALEVKNTDKVLHIGTGSGYFAALLAKLARQVVSIEIYPELSATAAQRLASHNIHNVSLEVADGVYGWPSEQHYDLIVYTGSSAVEPQGVRSQLNIGGRMFITLGEAPVMEATLITRMTEHGFRQDVLFETCIPALENAPKVTKFEF